MSQQVFDSVTLSVVFITAERVYDRGEKSGYSCMSGFFWRHLDQVYLITNWHNVTGVDPDTGKYIGNFTPTHFTLQFKYFTDDNVSGRRNIFGATRSLALYAPDDKKVWIEHQKGQEVDVVAIPLTLDLPEGGLMNQISKIHGCLLLEMIVLLLDFQKGFLAN